MNYIDNELENVINNEFDYSNIIPEAESILYLVKYFENTWNQFLNICEEDEKRNQPLKYEFQNYNYKKGYSRFEIYIREKSYNNITCKSFNSLMDIVKSGQLKNVKSLEIIMELNYRRGKQYELVEHENTFRVIFKPYEILFTRHSNHNESGMNMIENDINEIMKKCKTANSIFCTK